MTDKEINTVIMLTRLSVETTDELVVSEIAKIIQYITDGVKYE